MMKIFPTSRAYILVWMLALFAIVGCSDWIDTPATSNPNSMEHAPTIVIDAQRLLKQNGGFYLLNMALRDGKHTEKSKAEAISSKDLKVRWDRYHIFNDKDEEVVVIPIEGYHLTALSVLSIDGRSKQTKNKVTSKLIVRRGEDNKLVAVIGTYIYDQNYARDYQAELDTLGYEFENSHFTGYFITSRLDGLMLLGRSLKKGKESFAFRLNSHPEKADEDQPIHLHLDLNNQTHMTRSAFAEQESSSAEKCEDCGRYKGNCGCVEVIYCKSCKQQVQDGKCSCDLKQCDKCNYQKKYCICCPTCQEPKPYCRCHIPTMDQPNNGNNNGGSNNGSYDNGYSGGQSSNSSGNNSSGNYSGNASSGSWGGPSITPQKPNPYGLNKVYFASPGKIMSAANTTVEKYKAKRYKDDSGRFLAYCNKGVQDHFQQMFPGHNPPGMTGRANDMVKAWQNNTDYWVRIKGRDLKETLQKVKECVNAGLYVVAGWEHPDRNKSGHVVVVLPGEGRYNKRWDAIMPPMMDTGRDKRGTHYYLNNSFGPDKIPHVKFYYYKN